MNSKIVPRQWQSSALVAWKGNRFQGIAKVVTGGGKTTFAGMCAEAILKIGSATSVVIIVPTLALADQWFVAMQQDFGIPLSDLTIWSGTVRKKISSRWVVATFPTAAKYADELSGDGKALLIVDECHHAGAPTFLKLADQRWAATLGLSATPEREYDTTFEDIIEPVLGKVIVEYSYEDALKDGVICPFTLLNIRVPLTESESVEYSRISKSIAVAMSQKNRDENKIKVLLRKRARVSALAEKRAPAALKVILDRRGQRTMVFDESIDRINVLCKFLEKRGVPAATYHSRMGRDIARDNYAAYRSGNIKVLLTCHALDEGANVPETELAVLIASTASSRQRIQRLGRVLRPARGKAFAEIVTLFATDSEEKALKSSGAAGSVKWQEFTSQNG